MVCVEVYNIRVRCNQVSDAMVAHVYWVSSFCFCILLIC